MISPTSPRTTASALARMSVRSIAIARRVIRARRRPHLFARSTSRTSARCTGPIGVRRRRYADASPGAPTTTRRRSWRAPTLAGTTFVAEEQTAGHGRKARPLVDRPAAAARCSSRRSCPTTLSATDLWAVPFWVALAVADGIGRACGVQRRPALAQRRASSATQKVRRDPVRLAGQRRGARTWAAASGSTCCARRARRWRRLSRRPGSSPMPRGTSPRIRPQ